MGIVFQQNQTQINKENIRKNINRAYHNYKVRDKFMLNNHATYKYETPYKGPFVITKCFTNGTVNIQHESKKIRYNIHQSKPYKSDTNVEYINPKNMCHDVNI